MKPEHEFFVGNRVTITATVVRFESYRAVNPTRPIGNYLILKDLHSGRTYISEQSNILIKKDMTRCVISPGDKVSFTGMVDINRKGNRLFIRQPENFKVITHCPLDKYLYLYSNIDITLREARYAYSKENGTPCFVTQPDAQMIAGKFYNLGDDIKIRLSSIFPKGNVLGFDVYDTNKQMWETDALIFKPNEYGQRLQSKNGSFIYIPLEWYHKFIDITLKVKMSKFDFPLPYYITPINEKTKAFEIINYDPAGRLVTDSNSISNRRNIFNNLSHFITLKTIENISERFPELRACKQFHNGSKNQNVLKLSFMNTITKDFMSYPLNVQREILTILEEHIHKREVTR